MNFRNFFIRFLYFFSREKISNDLYLEGGVSLSAIYNLKRKPSNDIDFTIHDSKLILPFVKSVRKVLKSVFPDAKIACKYLKNRIDIFMNNKILFHIDVFPLDQELFEWEYANIKYKDTTFKIKTHTLVDILVEKICNVLQEDRFKYKDIEDINKIQCLYQFNSQKVKKHLLDKIRFKNIKLYKKGLLFQDIKRKYKIDASENFISEKIFNEEFSELVNLLNSIL